MRQKNVNKHTPGCLYINNNVTWPQSEPEPEISTDQWICVEDPVFGSIGSSVGNAETFNINYITPSWDINYRV